jgi:hypothetical protein
VSAKYKFDVPGEKCYNIFGEHNLKNYRHQFS